MSDAILAAEKALHEAALARAATYQEYAETYRRSGQVYGEPLNPETQAVCNATVRAESVLDRAAVRFAIAHGLLPAEADSRLRWLDDPIHPSKPDGCDSCNGASEALTLHGLSWLCELCLEKRLDKEADAVAP